MADKFAAALPPHVPAERFVRILLMAVQNQPELAAPDVDRRSLYSAGMKAAQDGLVIDGREAALVTFKSGDTKVVQYIPMTFGIIKKVRNSGELKALSAHVVYENDYFEYALGDDEHISHRPCLDKDRGKMIMAYSIAWLKDGGIQREIMTYEEIEQVRKVSKSGNTYETNKPKGIWAKWPGEMWKKTVIRRLSKRLPMSTDIEGVITAVDSDYEFKSEPEAETVPVLEGGKTRAAAIITGATQEPEEVPEEVPEEI
jgi:recombination protein RecT